MNITRKIGFLQHSNSRDKGAIYTAIFAISWRSMGRRSFEHIFLGEALRWVYCEPKHRYTWKGEDILFLHYQDRSEVLFALSAT